jgi:ketosteroid isomerase-like protein
MTDATVTADPKVESVQRLYGAYARGDVAAVLAELADDVDWAAEAAGTGVPWWGPYRGKDAVPGFFAAIGENVDVNDFEIRSYLANDDEVVAVVRWSFTVKATGKVASMFMQHWWRFEDGRIASFRGSEDTAQSLAAFAR